MNIPGLIAGLYPPAVRQRWGHELRHDLADAGPRSWPQTIAEAGKLWLHPSDWPERLTARNRRAIAVALLTLTTLTALLLRATTRPTGPLAITAQQPATALWLALILTGVLAALPLPRRRTIAIRSIAARTTRTLAVPGLSLLAMWITASSGAVEHPAPAAKLALLAWYWSTLTLGGAQACRLAARLAPLAHAPGRRRLRIALALLGTGLTVAAAQITTAAATAPQPPATLAAGAGLAALAATALTLALDLRHSAR